MGTIHLPQDFKEFFQSFNQHEARDDRVGVVSLARSE